MKNIHLNANVECTDGLCGTSTCVIIDPQTHQVTYIVVKEKARPHTEYMVPVDKVLESTAD